jgi:hypothetical protein
VSAQIDGADVRLSTVTREAWLQPIDPIDGCALDLESGWVSPSYGVRHPIAVVVLRGRVAVPRIASFRFGSSRLTRDQLTQIASAWPALADKEPCVKS